MEKPLIEPSKILDPAASAATKVIAITTSGATGIASAVIGGYTMQEWTIIIGLARFGEAPVVVIPDMGYVPPDDYWNQPQPCISPDGTHVVWAAPNGSGRVSAFVRRIA